MPEHCLKNFRKIEIKGKTLVVGLGKASIPYCEKIKEKIKSKYEGIIISTKTDPILILEAKLEGKNISTKNQLIQQLNPTVGKKFAD